ncbi:MAG: phage major capsid protein [Bacteroidales bacterium]|jgi:hypothetical protein|nr:phage major capsid protein [Bacteroidales bacterium]
MLGHKTRFNFFVTAFCALIVGIIALGLFVMQPEAAAIATLAFAPIAIVKGGNPKDEETLSQEEKDTLATIQKALNEAVDGLMKSIKTTDLNQDEVEKQIDTIVQDALDEVKSKDKKGNFSQTIKEIGDIRKSIKNVAAELESLKNVGGVALHGQSGLEKMVDEFIGSQKVKDFISNTSKSSGKIRFETKDISLTNDYVGDKLITTQSGYVREHPQPRKLNFRDLLTVDDGDENMPYITFSQITDLDREAAAVSENGLLPESAFKVREITAEVRRIGTTVFVSRRMIKSVKWLRSWLINRLPGWVRLSEDFQILKGDGQGDNFNGLLNQVPDFATVLGELITGAAGSIASVASYNGGTQSLINFTDPQPLLNNGMKITFAGFTGATGYNATFILNKITDKQIMIEFAYNSAAVATAATFSAGKEFAATVEDPNKADVLTAARAYLTYGEYTPNGVAVNPIDVFDIESLKDAQGRSLGLVTVINGVTHIKNIPVVESTYVVPGEFVIGDFLKGASLIDFTALQLEFAEDVQTKRKNEVALIIQEETIFPVYNPYSFLKGKFDQIIPLISK